MPRSLADRVATDVRAELGRQQMSILELARRTGLSGSYVTRRVSGSVPFDLDDLERIGAALGVPVMVSLPVAERAA